MTLTLPWPPSHNRYYRYVGGRVLISREGRAYRDLICRTVRPARALSGRLRFTAWCYQPDLRRRDLGNLKKSLEDCLTQAGVYEDDSQIDDSRYVRAGVDRKNPRVEIELDEL